MTSTAAALRGGFFDRFSLRLNRFDLGILRSVLIRLIVRSVETEDGMEGAVKPV